MSFDLFAEHGPGGIPAIDALVRAESVDAGHRISLLTLSRLSEQREFAKEQYARLAAGGASRHKALAAGLGLLSPGVDDLPLLPPGSLFARLPFKLVRSYLSKDDDSFYPIDNPVLKERVFRLPMVSASGWKGALRAAASSLLRKGLARKQDADFETWASYRTRLLLLFGSETAHTAAPWNLLAHRLFSMEPNEAQARFTDHIETMDILHDTPSRQGYLSCFPTYFDRLGFEILNPHDRSNRSGQDPVSIECVPAGSAGQLEFLFVPFDSPASSLSAEDLWVSCELAFRAAKRVLHGGFGAKTSSGYGRAFLTSPATVQIRSRSGVEERTFQNWTELQQFQANGLKAVFE